MKILAIDLPSHGFNSNLGMINLTPMTYRRMIKYSEDYSKDRLTQLRTDIELLKEDNPGIEELNYFDFDSVLMMKKLCSVTRTPKVKLECRCSNPECNATNIVNIGVSDLRYSNFDSDYAGNIGSIKVRNKVINVKLPKLKDVLELSLLLQRTRSEVSFQEFQTLCCMEFGDRPNDVVNAISTASLDEIALLEQIRNAFIGGSKKVDFECINCKGKESVAIDIVASDMFRILQYNEVVDQNKITLLGVPSS